MHGHGKYLALSLAVLGAGLAQVRAQFLITDPVFSSADAADSTHDTYTFRNTTTALESFVADGGLYKVGNTADVAYTRRGTTTPAQSSIWYRGESGSGAPFLGTHENDYGEVLLGNNINRGSDNTFANTGGVASGNIERLDFVWNGGLVADASFGVGVFERGDAGAHDAFRVALITGWDGLTSQPTAYSTVVAQAGNWGATNFNAPPEAPSTFGYSLFRYSHSGPTDNDVTTSTASSETGTQGLSGLLFPLSAFGLSPGTTIYGYSLFGYDVDPGLPGLDLLDWNTYPTDTTGATGTGGIDLAAINGIAFSAVPEPAAFGWAALAAAACASAWRRRPHKTRDQA